MRFRFALLLICLMLGASAVHAQFNAILINATQPLTLACGSGDPVPDGVTVQIFWDSLANGATADDRQPQEGPGFLQVNFNQFQLNGTEVLEVPGGFYTDPAFTMATGIPTPGVNGHPVYWLRLCLDAQGIYWQSDTFRVESGLNEYYFGTGDGEIPFTCHVGQCAGCPTPSAVTNITASQSFCDSIVVDWEHDLNNIAGYRVLIDGELPYHYIPGPANSRFVDTQSVGGQDHVYRVRAYRICGTGQDADTAFSTAVEVTGRKTVGAPTPQNVTASDDQCGRVEVNWSVNTVLGLDSFRIYRGTPPVHIGSANRGNAGQLRQFFDNAPLAGVQPYQVRPWSASCGEGTGVSDNGASGAAPTCQVTNVVASDDDCDEVCVTWSATCTDADSFQILRNTTVIGVVTATGGPNYSFCHAPPVGLVGGYQIRPLNDCGTGTLFPTTPEQGIRQGAPGQVTGIAASDTLCDRVRVTWTDLAAADQYEVRRTPGGTLATVAGDVNTYDDLTAVAGQAYSYTVVALNECGTGAIATGNQGTRRAPGTGTATFTLVTAGPPNWTYTMDVTSGCLNTVVIRDFCEGTTATAPTGWTVEVDDDSIIFSSTTAVGAQDAPVTGFVLSHPTCDGNGRWNIGDSGGSIRGPLPVGEHAEIPTEYNVKVFPNPFNPQTNFRMAIPQAAETRILVFNLTGQLVREMNLGRMQAGYHTVQFGGSELPSGMYFARVQAGNFHSTHKLMLLK